MDRLIFATVVGRVGGKNSTELVVKGVHREVPKEFIAELKDILQVMSVIIHLMSRTI